MPVDNVYFNGDPVAFDDGQEFTVALDSGWCTALRDGRVQVVEQPTPYLLRSLEHFENAARKLDTALTNLRWMNERLSKDSN